MAAFFAKVRYKSTQEWKEEIVYVDPDATLRYPRTRDLVKPRYPTTRPMDLDPQIDPRIVFGQWLTSPENPYFARNLVNRILVLASRPRDCA